MSTLTKVKLALVVTGLIVFAVGVRLDDARLRSIAIAVVAVAWVMRFVKPKVTETAPSPPPNEPG